VNPENPDRNAGSDDDDDIVDDNDNDNVDAESESAAANLPPLSDDDEDPFADSGTPVPRPRPGHQTPTLSATMARFAPVAAGVIRAVAGVLAFSAALLTLPIHFATPFLSGVGLLMLVGGCLSVVKECRDEPRLRWFSRLFPIACSVIVVVVGVIVAIYGAGVFAPDLRREPPPPPAHDGAIRFEP
jgi:hypothetical protein